MRLMLDPRLARIPATASSDRPVRVCFVIDRLSRAGTESQLLALIRHLDRRCVSPLLCLLNGADLESQSLLPVNCPTLDLRLKRVVGPSAIRAAARLVRFLRAERVDVVQTYFLDSTYFAVPVARLAGIRAVVRVRNNAGYWLTRKHRILGRIIGGACRVTLTNSDDGRRAVLAAEGLSPDRVRVIENGVDLDRFSTASPPDTRKSIVRVGAVANLRPVKNIDGLIRCAAVLCRQDSRVQFEIAGDGDLRSALNEQIRAAGLESRFRLVGAVTDIPRFLGTLDVAVLCSHSESMSNSLLEYMASGRAIVATNVGANARLVRHEREGLIVPASSDQALQDGIMRLLADPDLARSLGQAARVRVESEFGRAAMVRRFEDFFLSMIQ